MEIRINDRNVETLLALVEEKYEGILNQKGKFTVEERHNQVEALEELTAIKDALSAALRGGTGQDFGWQLIEE